MFRLFDVSKVSRYEKTPRHPAIIEATPPPPAMLAPFLNTGEDTRRAAGPAPRMRIIPTTAEPRTSTVSAIRFQDRSSHRTLDTQSLTSELSGTTSSHASGKASSISSSIMSDPLATSSASQITKVSRATQKSHSLPLVDKSKAAGLKEHSQQREGAHALLPFYACILILLVLFILHSFILLAPYADRSRARHAAKRTPKPKSKSPCFF
ncbi:uncharacterized protein LOC142558494 [Dermacentor variabilis]|uniref:uncharacterized protein LOC142558494 n=1 Tax=Dermacentor variabilis TaxID=34621 RepID=UPI003F5C8762